MIRDTYVMRNGKLVPKRLAQPLVTKTDAKVYVIGDVMEPTKHMGTGKVYDSKAKFRAETRAMGFVEAGTDPAVNRPGQTKQITQADIVPDVQRAIAELRSR